MNYYGLLDSGEELGQRQGSGAVRIEDLLGVDALSENERKRLARLAEALIVVLQTMVDAIRDIEPE